MQDQPSLAAHGLHGVDDQVRKHLAQLSGKGAHSPAIFKAALHFYRVGFQLVAIEREHVFQHGGDLHRLRGRSLAGKTQRLFHDVGNTRGLAARHPQISCGLRTGDVALQQVECVQYRLQRIIDLMGDGSGHASRCA